MTRKTGETATPTKSKATGAAKDKGAGKAKPKDKVKLAVRDLPGTPSDVPESAGRGRPTKYKPEYAEIAYRMCSRLGATNQMLADVFGVNVDTIREWRANNDEFSVACRVGKGETDDLVELSTVQHINGYHVEVEELDKFGVVHKLKKWIPGNAHAGMKWLSSRRPEIYREQKDTKHTLSMDDAFLRFLDHLEAQNQQPCDSQSPHRQLEVIDVQAVDVDEAGNR